MLLGDRVFCAEFNTREALPYNYDSSHVLHISSTLDNAGIWRFEFEICSHYLSTSFIEARVAYYNNHKAERGVKYRKLRAAYEITDEKKLKQPVQEHASFII